MHKKPLVAVLVLGLLLVTLPSAFARDLTATDDLRNKVQSGPADGPDELLQRPAGEPNLAIQAGTERYAPEVVCTGDWSISGDFFTNAWGNPALLPRSMAVYQDPNTLGDCAPGSFYTFDVLAVDCELYASGAIVGGQFQGEIWSVATVNEPACGGPGSITPGSMLAQTPVYTVNVPAGAGGILSLPFTIEACVTGPYFAVIKALPALPGGGYGSSGPIVAVVCNDLPDCNTVTQTLTDCTNWRYTTVGPWASNASFAGADRRIWSHGVTPTDLTTRCNPGLCAYQWWYEGDAADCVSGVPGTRQNDCWFANHPIPDYLEVGLNGERPEMWVRFNAIGLDTLQAIEILMGAFASDATMSVRVTVYEAAAGVSPDCGKPLPGAVRGFVDFPGALGGVVTHHYDLSSIPVADRVFGSLNGLGGSEQFFVGISLTPGVDPDFNVLAPAYGDVINDLVNPICVPDPHSGAFFTNYLNSAGPQHRYLGEFQIVRGGIPRYRHGELWMDALMCSEVLPAIESECAAGADDQWSSYAHDNRQTSASTIDVGDPNGVELAWTRGFSSDCQMTSPTVHNDIIYMSDDIALNAISLTTNVLLGTASGGPEMASSGNRGNTTVAFTRGIVSGPNRDLVFASGSTFNSITAWETNLETSGAPVWSRNGSLGTGLGQTQRYNTSKVVDVGGVDVLFVCTESPLNPGRIFAINAGTGTLFSGWATNPRILNAGVKFGPTVSGGKLYVATALGTEVDGSLYQINAADGAIDWTFNGQAGEGFPGGVAVEGDFIYAASRDAADVGYRYKINKSGGSPSVVWSGTQGVSLYGTPTIGRGFVYFPLDNPSVGLLQVDKVVGTVARNFAANSICDQSLFMVPTRATLSCDAYLFAGDRNNRWWLLNAVTGEPEWYRDFPSLPNATALVSASNGADYAVVSITTDAPTGGAVSVYSLNSGPRPRLIQCVYDVTVSVPLNSGLGQYHNEPDAVLNVGNEPLTFSNYTVGDPVGLASVKRDRRLAMRALENAAREFDGYGTIATSETISKSQRLAGLGQSVGEKTAVDVRFAEKLEAAKSRDSRSMAASASMIRTLGVTINGSGFPYILAPNDYAYLDWEFNGTGLGRGEDLNVLNLENDDPDWDYDAVNNGGISVAEIAIHYIGGCVRAEDTLEFGAGNWEHVFNYGAMGAQARTDIWHFATDPNDANTNLYDSGIMLFGDSTAGVDGGAQVRVQIYANSSADTRHFVPNTDPVNHECGFLDQTNVLLGAKRTGGCPGTPVDIFGDIITHSMSDTDQAAVPGTRMAAIGVDIIQTEVGAFDPLYGDFKLVQWKVINRDAAAKGPIYIGTWSDWDCTPAYAANVGNYSTAANGYYIYDNAAGGAKNAYGQLDFSARTTYSGIQPINPAKRIVIHDGALRQGGSWPAQDLQDVWSEAINETPAYGVDVLANSDKQGFLLNAAMNFGPYDTVSSYQAYFGVDATVEANVPLNMLGLAQRAARWSGFARGDVNDDGYVDLADVAWLQGPNPIYPGNFSGDVDADGDNDAADIARLLSFVSGNASAQPEGAWRFSY